MTPTWKHISEMTPQEQDSTGLIIYAPELVDLDFNPGGYASAYFRESSDEKETEKECIAAGYDNGQECYFDLKVTPLYYMLVERPPQVTEEQYNEHAEICYEKGKAAYIQRMEELQEPALRFARNVEWFREHLGMDVSDLDPRLEMPVAERGYAGSNAKIFIKFMSHSGVHDVALGRRLAMVCLKKNIMFHQMSSEGNPSEERKLVILAEDFPILSKWVDSEDDHEA